MRAAPLPNRYYKPGEASPFFDHTAVRAIRRHVQGDADRPDDADTGPGRHQVCHTGDLHLTKQVAQLFGSERVSAGDAIAGVTLKEDEVAEAKLGFRVTQMTPCAAPTRVVLCGELHHDRPVAVRVVGVRVLGRIRPCRRRGGSSTACTTAIRPSQQVRDRLGHIGNREQESRVRCLPPSSPCRARHILFLVHVVLPQRWLGLVPSVSYQLHPSLSPQLASRIVIAPALHHTPLRPPPRPNHCQSAIPSRTPSTPSLDEPVPAAPSHSCCLTSPSPVLPSCAPLSVLRGRAARSAVAGNASTLRVHFPLYAPLCWATSVPTTPRLALRPSTAFPGLRVAPGPRDFVRPSVSVPVAVLLIDRCSADPPILLAFAAMPVAAWSTPHPTFSLMCLNPISVRCWPLNTRLAALHRFRCITVSAPSMCLGSCVHGAYCTDWHAPLP
ncbi:hypothetical protein FB451DRAFT_1393814 [Mycena latifolia]|nr:hypothetical protein FB451DRAFT_1393814 [Mycena latifolia]